MRKINSGLIKKKVSELCVRANIELRPDVVKALKKALKKEKGELAQKILSAIIENALIAKKEKIPICQDTGIACVYIELGNRVSVEGDLKKAIEDGVKDGYRRGYLRKSVVADALKRINTGTNTPAPIYIDIIKGDRIRITIAPKGFGSENKSAIKMLKPTDGEKAIIDFVVRTVRKAGPDACPPFVVGVGIGGTFEGAAILSKRALLRPVGSRSPKGHFAALEKKILKEVNNLGIGPMGVGGKITALGVNIVDAPTHIAGLPVAVNLGCHVTRSAEAML